MVTNDDVFVLVEMTIATATIEPIAHAGAAIKVGDAPSIKRIVRTYLSRGRADEDLMLLRETLPCARFDIIDVEHIDN